MAEGKPVIRGPAFQNYGTLSHMPVDSTLEPLPPILADMDSPPGYEDIGIQYLAGKHFPLPPNLVSIQGDQPCLPQIDWKIPAISEDEAKEAFVEYVSSKCCYSKAPAMEMSLQDLQTFNTYRYRLETFTESRSTARKAEPYNGKGGARIVYARNWRQTETPKKEDWLHKVLEIMYMDRFTYWLMPNHGLPEKETNWDLVKDYLKQMKACPTCGTSGRCHCQKCKGTREQQCRICKGKGYKINDDRCNSCMGTGTNMCNDCSGMGITECSDCKGNGQVLVYIELTIEWKNNIYKHVSDPKIGFPTKLFDEVNGMKLFEDEQLMVTPVLGFPDHAIMQASRNAVEGHRIQFGSTRRILRQRQTIELILLSKVEYKWQRNSYSYYVYGNEHKVYAKDYPGTCWCTII
ncbi:protein SSUH2 homolog [Anolis carolinensis]|uniref:protein SSUH2 homolog n=1 Tax=Anolis carolinensis TaxID=28377 RepID=UPI002F2B6875